MTKYLKLIGLNWQSILEYRTNFILWRFRQALITVMALTVWGAVFVNRTDAFGYAPNQMISYIFAISVLQSLILATRLNDLAGQIYSGEISSLLIKPLNIFGFFASKEISDKAMNLLFVALEAAFLYYVFQPSLIVPTFGEFLVLCLWVALGIILHFFIAILFGCIGFWSPDIWGPKFLFFMLVETTAGKIFPLDILPKVVQNILFLTPFPYLSYLQTQLYLGRLTWVETWQYSLVFGVWILLMGLLTLYIWHKGSRDYAAAGQ